MNKLMILMLTFFGTMVVYSQDPDPAIFEDSWYLTELTVDGSIVETPSNPDFSLITLDLRELPTMGMTTVVCNSIGASITEFTDTFFDTNGFALFTYNCFEPSTFVFESIYFTEFYLDGNLKETFTYLIESGTNTILWLTVTNVNGDTARYGNLAALGIEDVVDNTFVLYPNPVTEKLFLQLSTGVIAQEIVIYDMQGRLISQEVPTQTSLIEIETASLYSGLYFVQVMDEKDQISVERFIKE